MISAEEQAQGLHDWCRYRALSGLDYRNEDEAWELSVLKDRLGIVDPPRVIYASRPFTYEEYLHFTGQAFVADLWGREILESFKCEVLFKTLLQGEVSSTTA